MTFSNFVDALIRECGDYPQLQELVNSGHASLITAYRMSKLTDIYQDANLTCSLCLEPLTGLCIREPYDSYHIKCWRKNET